MIQISRQVTQDAELNLITARDNLYTYYCAVVMLPQNLVEELEGIHLQIAQLQAQ